MNAQTLLEIIRGEGLQVKAIKTQIDSLREKAFSVGGFDYGTERVVSNPPQQAPFERSSITAIDLMRKYNNRLNEYADRVDYVQRQIDCLKDYTEQTVLIMRYLSCLEWKEITVALDKSERTVFNIHKKAVDNLQAVLESRKD